MQVSSFLVLVSFVCLCSVVWGVYVCEHIRLFIYFIFFFLLFLFFKVQSIMNENLNVIIKKHFCFYVCFQTCLDNVLCY